MEKGDEILNKVQQDRHISSDDIAKELKIEHRMVLNHLEKIGYRKKFDVWVPYNSKLSISFERISICEALLRRNELNPFLERMITGGAKWITCIDHVPNPSRKPFPFREKAIKVLLCVWWDWKGVVHHEWRRSEKTTDPEFYSQQLMRLRNSIRKERPELMDNIVYQYENSTPFTSISSRRKLEEFGWEVLRHPSHSADLTPSDYHLFPSLPKSFSIFVLMAIGRLKRQFDEKPQTFYSQGIMTLPEKWQKVIDQNGDYLEEHA